MFGRILPIAAVVLLAGCGAEVTPEGARAWLGVVKEAKDLGVETAKDVREIRGEK